MRESEAGTDDIESVITTFIERHCAGLRSRDEIERILKREIAGKWKGRGLRSITKTDIHELLDAIVDRGAPIMANRAFACLRKMCRFAMARGVINADPCAGITRPAQESSRDRVLSDKELTLVWRAAKRIGWPYGPFVQLLILTGQRRMEIAGGRWNEIDADAKLWKLPASRVKNKRPHDVPLSPQALAIIEKLPRIDNSGLMFSTNGETVISGFAQAKIGIDAEITKLNGGASIAAWTFHDLRRTVASGMQKLGVSLEVIEKCLNHVSGSFSGIVGVYQHHQFKDEKRDALCRWGRHVAALV